MIKSARFVDEKTPSCENCICYSVSIKKNSKNELTEMAHGRCWKYGYSLKAKPYKQRHEFCKQWSDKGDVL